MAAGCGIAPKITDGDPDAEWFASDNVGRNDEIERSRPAAF